MNRLRLRKALQVGVIKSLWINFYCLPFRQAVHLPILVSRNTKLCVANRQCISVLGGVGCMSDFWMWNGHMAKRVCFLLKAS